MKAIGTLLALALSGTCSAQVGAKEKGDLILVSEVVPVANPGAPYARVGQIALSVRVENRTSNSIIVPLPRGTSGIASELLFSVHVFRNDGSEVIVPKNELILDARLGPTTRDELERSATLGMVVAKLEPGESRSIRVALNAVGGVGRLRLESGHYALSCTYSDEELSHWPALGSDDRTALWRGTATSNRVSFEVASPDESIAWGSPARGVRVGTRWLGKITDRRGVSRRGMEVVVENGGEQVVEFCKELDYCNDEIAPAGTACSAVSPRASGHRGLFLRWQLRPKESIVVQELPRRIQIGDVPMILGTNLTVPKNGYAVHWCIWLYEVRRFSPDEEPSHNREATEDIGLLSPEVVLRDG